MQVDQILTNATGTGAGTAYSITRDIHNGGITFLVVATATGALTGTVIVEASNTPTDANSWVTAGTITLNGTNNDKGGFASAVNWSGWRARVSAITGVSTTINVYMGY